MNKLFQIFKVKNFWNKILATFFLLVIFTLLTNIINAEETLVEETLNLPGTIENEGTHFEITNSQYLNVILDSSEPIKLRIESIPEMLTMMIESSPSTSTTSTQIIISGLVPLTIYYKYEDDYHNLEEFTADENGRYSYIQDLSKPHFVFIQTRASTKFIKDDATGGDCYLIGIWDGATKTCTLTKDLYETIQIDSNNIILNGNGYWVDGYQAGLYMAGVYLPNKSGITVKNIKVKNFHYGIYLLFSASSTVSNNFLTNNTIGISLSYSNNNIISNNAIDGGSLSYFTGISFYESRNDNIIEFNSIIGSNNPISIWNVGIWNNVVTNTIFRNNTIINSVYGIYLTNSYYNQIYNNNFISNRFQIYLGWNVGGNVFNLFAPIGGNYWSNFDTPAEGCNDSNNDNFCDSPYIFSRGQDNLPWTKQDGWKVPVNQSPTISNLNQYKSDGIAIITESGITAEDIVVFKATLTDQDNDQVQLEAELRQFNELFTGLYDGGIVTSTFVNSGSEVVVNSQSLVDGQYHWRTRAIDSQGNASDWQEFGTAGNVDFEVRLAPLYTQVESDFPSRTDTERWAILKYAKGNSNCGYSIANCGCALTSSVMVLRYYDVDDIMNSQDINPQTLNDWLNAQPKGYLSGGMLNWLEVARYSGYKIKYDIAKSGDYVNDFSRLNESLNKNQPAIAKEKAGRGGIDREHFIVIDNKLAATYGVKDPAWYNTQKLNEITNSANKVRGYDNGFDGLRLFYPGNGIADAAISLNLASPAEFLVIDPIGRRFGKDPITNTEYNEIPDASYFSDGIDDATEGLPSSNHENKVVYIGNPLDGQYDVKVIGTGSGSYTIELLAYDNQGQIYLQTISGNTDVNVSAAYDLNYNAQQAEDITIQPEDIDAPIIFHTSLNSEYILNSSPIVFNFFAQDSGTGVFKLSATLDSQLISDGVVINFNQIGEHAIVIEAEDFVGNKRTETITYQVIYDFSGFLSPIKTDGTGIYKLGRTLPIKFQLKDVDGIFILNVIAQLFAAKIQDGIVGTDEIPLSTSAADTGNLFRYDDINQQYIYNLATDSLSTGSWQLKVILDDGKNYVVLISLK